MINNFDLKKLDNVQMDGVHHWDYPDFCDGFLASADYDGRELTEGELDWIADTYPEYINEQAYESFI
jgi:hypothetical protein